MTKLIQLQEQATRAEDALNAAVARRFKPGMTVHVEHGDHATPVVVVDADGWYGRVRVRNEKTGREYAIDAYRLSEFRTL